MAGLVDTSPGQYISTTDEYAGTWMTGLQRRLGALIERELEDGVLLLDTESGRIHQLNETAGFIWRRCQGAATPAEIASSMAQEYGVDHAVAARDVEELLAKLKALSLVVDRDLDK
jgi:hypothetical protein